MLREEIEQIKPRQKEPLKSRTNYKAAVLLIFSKENTAPDLVSFDEFECDIRM